MTVKTPAIVTAAVRYQEKGLVVTCFTQVDGRVSYFVPNAYSTRKGAPKAAFFLPLTLLELEAVHKKKGTLESIREIRIAYPYTTLHGDVMKGTIALFLSEMLHHSLHDGAPNPPLYALLEAALQWLDNHSEVANFHLILLLEMTKHLGFYPDLASTGRFFDLRNGRFQYAPGVETTGEEVSASMRTLAGLRFGDAEKAFTSAQRRELLKLFVQYYSAHIEGFRKPKSLEVLAEVFS
ncbi:MULTISPECIES: DNA repair protein RecO [unclassified Flavobacterium]|uniref:DNA repair protein RecO n=1 Tax=unclassified Flavobacterium TaxID=196869 RepID=UPI001F12D957|nr:MULTISPECIES: DNA repair protein RecO [unclassified Flavobacterium]UMY66475.1 DNA repair protein RecO [Flavobacterium sp. HJ-32-4]